MACGGPSTEQLGIGCEGVLARLAGVGAKLGFESSSFGCGTASGGV